MMCNDGILCHDQKVIFVYDAEKRLTELRW